MNMPPSDQPDDASAMSTPDLDAGAPVLLADEQQRLNRKAIAFLGGSLLLLVLVAILVLRTGGDPSDSASVPAGSRVQVPSMPREVSALPSPAVPLPAPSQEIPPIPLAADPTISSRDPSGALPPLPVAEPAPPVREREPTLVERRIADASAGAAAPGGGPVAIVDSTALASPSVARDGDAGSAVRLQADAPTRLKRPDTTMVRGTYLRCVLETRIVSDLDGFAACVLTEPVYAFNGRTLLLPKGSKIYGEYKGGDFVNDRMAVLWDRVLTPDGIDVALSAPGIDHLGSSGMPGQYSAHWGRRIGSALMISLLSDAFKYYAADQGPAQTGVSSGGIITQQPFESNTAESIQRLAENALQGNAKRPPTVTINQGTVVNIYVTRDIDFVDVLGRG